MRSYLPWRIGYILSSFFFWAVGSPAKAADEVVEEQKPAEARPHHHGTLSSVNLGIRYSSVLQNRGLVLYRDFQIDPVLGIFLFDDRFEYLGDSVGFRDFIFKEAVRLRTRLVAISDKPLFPAYASIRKDSADRRDTYEWSNRLEIFLPGYSGRYRAEMDVEYAKDLVVHHGNYLEAQVKVKLYSARLPAVGTQVEPNFYSSLGWGDSLFNRYFYGPNATTAGLDNFAVGIWCAFPEEADRYYPIIQLKYFQAVGESRQGEYAARHDKGWLFSFIATAGLLE